MPPFLHRTLVLYILSFFLSGYLSAQAPGSADPQKDSLSRYIHTKYGLDQKLFNGFQYYKRLIKYKGDPFFPEDSFYEGSVSIGGVDYEQVQLKYNCFSQSLVLEYTDYQGRYNQLSLNTAHIDSFQLGSACFQKLSLQGEAPLFYQVLRSPHVCSYIQWKKMINATSDDLQYSYEYSKALRTNYISYRGEIQTYTNKKSFLSVFSESMAVEIKKFLRNQRTAFKEASPGDIQNLLNYISQLEETPSEH